MRKQGRYRIFVLGYRNAARVNFDTPFQAVGDPLVSAFQRSVVREAPNFDCACINHGAYMRGV